MEDYCTFEQCVKLKELGFDWECNHVYYGENATHVFPDERKKLCDCFQQNSNVTDYRFSAPTLAQAQKWLRETKDICIIVLKCCKIGNSIDGKYYSEIRAMDGKMIQCTHKIRETYEQALSSGIDEALELLKQPDM